MRVFVKLVFVLCLLSGICYAAYFAYTETVWLDWLKSESNLSAAASAAAIEGGTFSESSSIVSVTGKIKPAKETKLAFERGGVVDSLLVSVGDRVKAGEGIIKLDTKETEADLARADTIVKSEKANLADLIAGATSEDLAVTEQQLVNSQTTLSDAKNILLNTIRSAFVEANGAVRNDADKFFDHPDSTAPIFGLRFVASDGVSVSISANNFEDGVHMTNLRKDLGVMLTDWQKSVDSLTISSDLLKASVTSKENLDKIGALLDAISSVINNASFDNYQSTIDGYKDLVALARRTVNTTKAGILSAEQSYNSAKSDVYSLQRQNDLKKSGPRPQAVSAQKERVRQAEATLESMSIILSKMTITAPSDGVVSFMEAKKGELISSGEHVVTVIDDSGMYVEAYVAEVNVGKISLGNKAEVTMDAFSDTFSGTVSFIDPAETVVNDIPTFKIKVQLENPSQKLKSGMTANVKIMTDSSSAE